MPRQDKNGRRDVQAAGSSKECTKLAIDVSVHGDDRGAVVVHLAAVRANLRAIFEGERVIVVGNHYHPRAIIIPLGPIRWLSQEEKTARAKRLREQLKIAVEEIGE